MLYRIFIVKDPSYIYGFHTGSIVIYTAKYGGQLEYLE